ncbi:MAG: hypothetical protein DMG67_08250 [Acidobacteria bacterium]|nr:MAG: hypothetical protein DMG67_08250 [Acidobacteriota bacterium]
MGMQHYQLTYRLHLRLKHQERHTLLEVVVPLSDGLLTSERRQGEIVTVLDLLDELVPSDITGAQFIL